MALRTDSPLGKTEIPFRQNFMERHLSAVECICFLPFVLNIRAIGANLGTP